MKLVDLLAKDLKEWPDCLGVFTQDEDREVYFYEFEFIGYEWEFDDYLYKFLTLSELAEDYKTATVTKEQWEAARMKEDDISD